MKAFQTQGARNLGKQAAIDFEMASPGTGQFSGLLSALSVLDPGPQYGLADRHLKRMKPEFERLFARMRTFVRTPRHSFMLHLPSLPSLA